MSKALWWIVGGVVGLGLVFWMAISIATEPELDPSTEFGEVVVDGAPLPVLGEPGTPDPALGTVAPSITGSDWEGRTFHIGPDGRPKILLFLAHWCPHCQAEVPEVVTWLAQGGLPANVDMYSLSVGANPTRPNFPPSAWLEREGWTLPVIRDDEAGSTVRAYGMSGTPFYVVLDGDNRVVLRVSGRIGTQGLEALVALAEEAASG
ncbi:MAG: TlpA family protein disulfide reductase [Acidimicrobiia bacterium]